MKICWDNLEGFSIGKRSGELRKGTIIYIEKEKCVLCGEPYLMNKYLSTDYCSKSCSYKFREFSDEHKNNISKSLSGRKFSEATIEKMSKVKIGKEMSEATKNKISESNIGREFSEETRLKLSIANCGKKRSDEVKQLLSELNKGKHVMEKNNSWKGGVIKSNLALYDTYAHQLSFAEDVNYCYDNKKRKLIEVICSKCKKWFVPKLSEVKSRVCALNGTGTGECGFYCSQECKDNCEVFGKNPLSYINLDKIENFYTTQELSIWSQEVLKRAKNKCEICDKKAAHTHHIEPKKLMPALALDPENGLALCKICHYKFGHVGGCSTGSLASAKCLKENSYE